MNKCLCLKLYRLYLEYTYPALIAIGTNNVIYKRGDRYWLDFFSIIVLFFGVTTAVLLLPITVIITETTGPLNENQLRAFFFTVMVLNIFPVVFIHKRNRIKPVLSKLKKLPIEEVKRIKRSFLVPFLLYYIVPMAFGFIFSFVVADLF